MSYYLKLILKAFLGGWTKSCSVIDLWLVSVLGYLCPTPQKGKKSWEVPLYRVLRHKIGSIHLEHGTSKIFEKPNSVKT